MGAITYAISIRILKQKPIVKNKYGTEENTVKRKIMYHVISWTSDIIAVCFIQFPCDCLFLFNGGAQPPTGHMGVRQKRRSSVVLSGLLHVVVVIGFVKDLRGRQHVLRMMSSQQQKLADMEPDVQITNNTPLHANWTSSITGPEWQANKKGNQ